MLTVIIASRNGEKTLPHVLNGYSRLLAPRGGWKLVFADNGSTDRSLEIVREYGERLPITLVSEPRRGQNWARLRALEHIEGDLVVFSDDDATPEADWLVRLREAADTHQSFDFFAGAIKPRWETEPPPWILRRVNLGLCFAVTDPKLEEGPIEPYLVWSPNMAFRRRIFDLGYRFDPAIGPSGTSYAMGSESDFTRRLGAGGFKAWYCPAAKVHHFIREAQFDEKWLLGRAFRYGRGTGFRAVRESEEQNTRPPGMSLWMARRLIMLNAQRALAWVRRDPEELFAVNWEIACLRGYLFEIAESKKAPHSRAVPAVTSEGR